MTTKEVLQKIAELIASIDEEDTAAETEATETEATEAAEVIEDAPADTEGETVRTETTTRTETVNTETGEGTIKETTEITFKDGVYYGI